LDVGLFESPQIAAWLKAFWGAIGRLIRDTLSATSAQCPTRLESHDTNTTSHFAVVQTLLSGTSNLVFLPSPPKASHCSKFVCRTTKFRIPAYFAVSERPFSTSRRLCCLPISAKKKASRFR